MSGYSVPKRLLHLFCGGSAIWLGTTFCSPLAAIDTGLPPTQASAPDALADPAQTAQQSIVPAASLETEQADHWDTGPVLEDGFCDYDYPCGDEYCDDFYGKTDNAYDYADPEEPYAGEASTELEDTSCPDEFWCDEDACYDEYDYGYGEMNSAEEQSEEVTETPVAEAANSAAEDEFAYEFDDYEMYYDYEDEYGYYQEEYESNSQPVADEMAAEETATAGQAVSDEADESHESEWEDYYYEDEYGYYQEEYESDSQPVADEMAAEETATAGQAVSDEVDESHESEWEDYYYEDEYYQEGYESDNQPVAEEMAAEEAALGETDAEEAWADEYDYEYDAYEYDSYDYDANDYDGVYDMEEAGAVTDESAADSDESYDYVDPMDQYGHEYEVPYEWQEMEEDREPEVDPDLLAKQPAELLGGTDCDLIRSIARLSDQPSAVRRACLNEYIEALGFEAIDFAYRYEDATDADVLTLADDLPGAAAFLASYRLVEQGRIGMDDAVILLEDALSGLSLDWIGDVGRIAAGEQALSATHPVVDAMATVATRSIAGVSALAAVVSERLADLPWAEVSHRLEEFRSASRTSKTDDVITF